MGVNPAYVPARATKTDKKHVQFIYDHEKILRRRNISIPKS